MKLARDIMSLSTFKRDSQKVMRQMKRTKEPIILTINSKGEFVVQDTESYQHLLELKERQEAIEGIRRGLESIKQRRGKTLEQFILDFSAQYGFNPDVE